MPSGSERATHAGEGETPSVGHGGALVV
eukprot:COSAG02_NODE_40357_length_406_cov_1.172638_1_plen_27_part_01